MPTIFTDESTSESTHQEDLIAYGLREDCAADIVSRLGADENLDIWEILLERLRTYPNLGYHRTPEQYKNAAICFGMNTFSNAIGNVEEWELVQSQSVRSWIWEVLDTKRQILLRSWTSEAVPGHQPGQESPEVPEVHGRESAQQVGATENDPNAPISQHGAPEGTPWKL